MCNGTSLNTNKVPKEKPDRQVPYYNSLCRRRFKNEERGRERGEIWRPGIRPTSPQVSVIGIHYNFGNKTMTTAKNVQNCWRWGGSV